MKILFLCLGICWGFFNEAIWAQPSSQEAEQAVVIEAPYAGVVCLDKSTGRVRNLILPLGKEVVFERLLLKAKSCLRSAPDELPEAVCDLEIKEQTSRGEQLTLFHDCMYASTPAIRALDHPIYDVWLLDCFDDPHTARH